jgi:ABC-type bacteriocin/lantibiotic exporter with double-glycine peptidase domain
MELLFGHDPVELHQRCPLSLKGAKLSQFIHIAQSLGFQSRPLRTWRILASSSCPAKKQCHRHFCVQQYR